jgi:hypothetical protein
MTESSYQHAWKPEGYEIQSLENMVFAISCKFSTVCYTVDVFERMNTYGNVNCTQVVSDFSLNNYAATIYRYTYSIYIYIDIRSVFIYIYISINHRITELSWVDTFETTKQTMILGIIWNVFWFTTTITATPCSRHLVVWCLQFRDKFIAGRPLRLWGYGL